MALSPDQRRWGLGLGISLDGYIARSNGAVDFLFMPKDYSMAAFFGTIDTALMGRKTLKAALIGGQFHQVPEPASKTRIAPIFRSRLYDKAPWMRNRSAR